MIRLYYFTVGLYVAYFWREKPDDVSILEVCGVALLILILMTVVVIWTYRNCVKHTDPD